MSTSYPELQSDIRRIVTRARDDGIAYGKEWAKARQRDIGLMCFMLGALAGIAVGVFL